MYTKSIIQQTVEALQTKGMFKDRLDNLMNKYIIEDSVFLFKNNNLHEVVEGYFEVEKEFDNLTDAIRECNSMCIRVINNTTFMVGNLRKTISECNSENKVFDLDRLTEVR